MASTTEGEHTLPDGFKLYTKTWHVTENPPKAIALYFHGFSDHCNMHYDYFPYLASRGIEVRSFDQRGWGRSVYKPSQRGLTGPTATVVSDHCSVMESLPSDSTPKFLISHSMGGGLATFYHLLTLLPEQADSSKPSLLPAGFKPPQFAGIIVEAPWLGLHPASVPSSIKIAAGRLVAKLLPTFQITDHLDEKYMSHREDVCQNWKNDPLCHDTSTAEGAANMLDRHAELEALAKGKYGSTRFAALYDEKNASAIAAKPTASIPILALHGSEDRTTSYPITMALFGGGGESGKPDRLPFIKDKEFVSFEGSYHVIHSETEPWVSQFHSRVANWILERAGKPDAAAGNEPSSKL